MVEQSLVLTSQIRAVDVADAVTLVLNSHFLPDLMGNLKSYATQKFRCKVCGTVVPTPAAHGRCSTPGARGAPCGGSLTPTVFEGAVRKYLAPLAAARGDPGVTPYVRQRVELLGRRSRPSFPAPRPAGDARPVPSPTAPRGEPRPPGRRGNPHIARPPRSGRGLVG